MAATVISIDRVRKALEPQKRAKTAAPRPVSTVYFAKANGKHLWQRVTHSATKVGAARAALGHLMRKEYYKAFIRCENSTTLIMERVGRNIVVHGNWSIEDIQVH